MWFDEPTPGTLWAVADTYKASLAADGFTFIPYFGADAAKNYPLKLIVQEVRMAGARVSLRAASPGRRGQTVELDRGVVREQYDFAADHVEQKFVVARCPDGDLEIRLRVESELETRRDADGLRFVHGRGHVGYTDAVLVDALGNRFAMQTELVDGDLRLRASMAALDSARFPVTIDPIIRTFTAYTETTWLLYDSDIAYAQSQQTYLVLAWRVFSAADGDVYATSVDREGNLIAGSGAWIDMTADRWRFPRVAYNRLADRFLVVAERSAGAQQEVWGRLREGSSTAMLLPQQISESSSLGHKNTPDVGGDFGTGSPTYFAVVWQRETNATNHDVQYRMIRGDGTFHTTELAIDDSVANDDFRPRISKCNGAPPTSDQAWIVVWQRLTSPSNHDIFGARLRYDGAIATSPFAIDQTVESGTNPSVSSLTDGSGGGRHWLVAYESGASGDRDIYARAFRDGVSPTQVAAQWLAILENLDATYRLRNQSYPAVDSDGCRFAIAYGEEVRPTANDWNPLVSTVHLGSGAAGGFGLTEGRVVLDSSGGRAYRPGIVATRAGGGEARYGIAWADETTPSSPSRGVEGAVYVGIAPTGGYVVHAHGCGGVTLTNDNLVPALGAPLRFTVGGTTNSRFIMVSVPIPPLTLCPPQPCRVGVALNQMVPFFASTASFTIPCNGALVGQTVAIQGGAVGMPGGCAAYADVALSDTHEVTIR